MPLGRFLLRAQCYSYVCLCRLCLKLARCTPALALVASHPLVTRSRSATSMAAYAHDAVLRFTDTARQMHALFKSSTTADDKEALRACFKTHLRQVFFKCDSPLGPLRITDPMSRRLAVDPKQRKVVVCENILLPVAVKEALSSVLFTHFSVSGVSFYPSAVLSLLAVGRHTGLTIDCGNLDTVVLPVSDGRPVTSCLTSSPIGGAALRSAIWSETVARGAWIDRISGTVRSLYERRSSALFLLYSPFLTAPFAYFSYSDDANWC